MTLATNLTAVGSVLSALANAGATASQLTQAEGAVKNFITEAETFAVTGEQKLAAVVSATQTYVSVAFPELEVDAKDLAADVSALASGIVTLWNDLKTAAGDVVKVAEEGVDAVKSALGGVNTQTAAANDAITADNTEVHDV